VALLVRLRLAEEQLQGLPGQAGQVLIDAESELVVALDELRELSHGTHPALLTDLGLATAIRSVAARAGQRIHLIELPTERVDPAAEQTAYYVFLEAVTNAQKHAPNAIVSVRARAKGHMLTIAVSDNGPGGATESTGGGLAGLRERVEEAGGALRLRSIRGSGTTITAALPL
jgi:signal transduction histidine kinase